MTEEEREAEYKAAYNELRRFVRQFSEDTADENDGLELGVDFSALWNLSRSYVDDLNRYAAYHNAPIPDHARRCAFLCKWLMKFRPLVVRNPAAAPGEDIETFGLMANEVFATWCAASLMEINWSELSETIRIIFLYSLRHRSNSEDTYILFFAQLCHL